MNVRNAELDIFIWFICRNIGSSLEVQPIPSWAGLASHTAGICYGICTRVDYMPPISFSMTNATVQHILELSLAASLEVGQQ